MSVWHETMDEYGDERGMEVLGEIAATWFRRPLLEPDEGDFSGIAKMGMIHNAWRIQSDLDEGLETFTLEQMPFAVMAWYAFAKAYVLDLEDRESVDVGKLYAAIEASIKHHGTVPVYKALIDSGKDAVEEVKRDVQYLKDLPEDAWESRAVGARYILDLCEMWLLAAHGHERLGFGYDPIYAMLLDDVVKKMIAEVMPHVDMFAEYADRYITGHTYALEVSTDPEKWLYVGDALFDFWYELARAVDRHFKSFVGKPDVDPAWMALIESYLSRV